MTEGTRRNVQDSFGDLFEVQNVATRVAAIMRGHIFGWGGRVLYNLITTPGETMAELTSPTFLEKIRTRALSNNFHSQFIFRTWFQALIRIATSALLFTQQ